MLYLVSGSSRSGKTLIARKILEQKGIPYLSLDWIMMGFTHGMPQCGIHDKLFPDEIAARLQSFLFAMCENMLWAGQDCVIEGEAILPEAARTLLNKHPDDAVACFLGYAHIDLEEKFRQVKTHREGGRDWLTQEPDATIRRHLANMIDHSRKVETQCARHDVRYFDTSTAFRATLDQATSYLLNGS